MYEVVVTARSFGKGNDAPIKLLESSKCRVKKISTESALTSNELIEYIENADAVIAGLDDFSAEVINAGKKLKVISRYGVGYDKVDIDEATKKGIAVTVTPGANENSVADLAVGAMLACARHIPQMDQQIKNNKEGRALGFELWGKTCGIIGTGRIGRGVIKRLSGFNMRFLCHDKYPNEELTEEYDIKYCELEELLSESDFISIHCPLTVETRNMIGEKQLKMMKNSAVIVNTARGGIIDEDALYHALKGGIVAAAALDATLQEPSFDSPLLTLQNCLITPHIGGYTMDAVLNMGMLAAQNVINILEDKKCPHKIN
ncbi:phosphoglycerate dehydrogenase [Sporosarcina sp. Marseille-Q4063]|uniref:phosphoglycerate dehydrogenase n=1 Tax=Sporosarcina sp. Marseille-Q4063 TaxID=2810514 RepID=UPI001BAFF295|nr:phosphoglycerate dehydrogenase [Sporosarcina sp. Marseille-Q4063]QUW21355.1 phosphoglycerate dehydrogenase [Sporosarcina sp. Marseille-Q4063]